MTLRVLTFGIARDIAGGNKISVEMPEGATVGALKAHLLAQYPQFESLSALFIAVNAEYEEDHAVLQERDEIALIPPVSGG
jgi:molybdopterin synthase sulfur carrier subunit